MARLQESFKPVVHRVQKFVLSTLQGYKAYRGLSVTGAVMGEKAMLGRTC